MYKNLREESREVMVSHRIKKYVLPGKENSALIIFPNPKKMYRVCVRCKPSFIA
jgi:hypothetical protein